MSHSTNEHTGEHRSNRQDPAPADDRKDTGHRRVLVCLDVRGGRVVKGVSFKGLRDVGDPVELALRYQAEGADEIVLLDISASLEERRTLLDVVQRAAGRLSVPLTVGGGIRDLDDIDRALQSGASKVSINTAGIERPALFSEGAARYGPNRLVASIDAKRVGASAESSCGATGPARYTVYTHGGRVATGFDVTDWARRCTELGAGEILLTSIDRDGRRTGYDLELTRAVADIVEQPVIASGGAGTASHIRDAFTHGRASGALAAGIFHDGTTTITAVKRLLAEADCTVGPAEETDA